MPSRPVSRTDEAEEKTPKQHVKRKHTTTTTKLEKWKHEKYFVISRPLRKRYDTMQRTTFPPPTAVPAP